MVRIILAISLCHALACGSSAAPVSSAPASSAAQIDRRVENLRAFAVLYGHVKYFHPSDEAAKVDWDRFAVHGAARVIDAADAEQLATRLREVFAPIAPTVQISLGTLPSELHPALSRSSTAGLKPVAWQHVGPGLDGGTATGPYKAGRTNRARSLDDAPSGCVGQSLAIEKVAGKRVRVRARLRSADGAASQVHLSLGTYEPGADNSRKHDISPRLELGADWKEFEFTRSFSTGIRVAVGGVCLLHVGEADVDSVSVDVEDGKGWKPLALANHDFAAGDKGWNLEKTGFEVSFAGADGAQHAHISQIAGRRPWSLFAGALDVGEVSVAELGAGLRARVPLAVWADEERTLPVSDWNALAKSLEKVEVAAATETAVGAGAVIVAWNSFQHFYPYFDVVEVDWSQELDRALLRALAAKSTKTVLDNLDLLVAALGDGHGSVSHPAAMPRGGAALPVEFDWVQDKLVITASGHKDATVGDVVVSIAGVPFAQWRGHGLTRASGSPQWKRTRMVWQLKAGAPGSTVKLELEGADGKSRAVELTRGKRTSRVAERLPPHINKLDGGVYYVDLTAASWPEIQKQLDAIAAAPGVIFDLRGYPNSNHQILGHLLTSPDDSKWMFTAKIQRPNQRKLSWNGQGWKMQPAKPHVGGQVVFLTDGRAISYAESVMGFVHGHQLGAIVGSETAGANGNVFRLSLPGGFEIYSTGMKVLRQDGKQLHGLGFPPTLRAARTLAGVRAGRDEVLEAGLTLVREKLAK